MTIIEHGILCKMEGSIMNETGTDYSTIKDHFKKIFLVTEGFGYGVLVPVVIIAVILISKLSLKEALIFIGISTGIAIVGSMPFLLIYRRNLNSIFNYLKNSTAISEENVLFITVRRRFYSFPVFHLTNTVLRWLVLFPIVVIFLGLLTNNTHIQNVNVWALLPFSALLSAVFYYFTADFYITKIASLGVFPADLNGKARISSPLSFIAIATASVGIILMLLVVLNVFYNSIERAYVNQMKNITEILDRNIEKFYEERIGDAKVLLKNPITREGIRKGRYDEVTRLFKIVYDEYGVYENVFISTPEKDSMIVASPVKGSAGLRYRAAGYGENIDATLSGKIHFSNANKSPVTGLPVMLMTAPIKDGDNIIGILGMPVELGKFTHEMVSSKKIGVTGYAFILDETMKATGHPDKNQLLVDFMKFDVGNMMKNSASGSLIRYMRQGKHEILMFIKNKKYGFYSAATISLSDIDSDVINAEIILFILMAVCMVVIALVITFFISRKLKPLSENEKLIESLATGDLTKSAVVTSNDEIGRISQRLKTFIDELRSTIGNIQNISNEVATSAEEMSGTSVSFADNAQSQAASAEQVTATVEEVSAGVENVAGNALSQFDRLSSFIKQMQHLSESINEMGQRLQEALNISRDIATTAKFGEESLNNMTSSMGRIIESSNEMTNIVDMINGISEQINLLSLNAAIEAARAGDAGRGFAVVADEISKLADQTASSIKEIDKFIRSNTDEINRGKENINSTIKTISAIIKGVNDIGDMMNVLSDFMKKQLDTNAVVNRDALEMRNRSNEMKGSTEEQKTAVAEIVKSVSSINELTQANAAGAEEIAGTSESISSMAENLKRAVGFFRL